MNALKRSSSESDSQKRLGMFHIHEEAFFTCTACVLLCVHRRTDGRTRQKTQTDTDRRRQSQTVMDRQRQTETDRDRHRQMEGQTDSHEYVDTCNCIPTNMYRHVWTAFHLSISLTPFTPCYISIQREIARACPEKL